jgi:HEAT repeat protein
MRFVHPVIGGFLAGNLLGTIQTDQILSLPNWIGKYLAMNYFAALGNADDLAQKIINKSDHPLERNIMIVARWLRITQVETGWRNQVMERLVNLLLKPAQPLGFRSQVLAAIVLGGDPGAPLLFRQMLTSDDPELIQICMLGCASLKDTKAVEEIAKLLSHPSPNVQKTACLALVTIGTLPAIDHVASVLLHGDDNSRAAAAKALSNHPEVGHEMLREGASLDDIMVRRAVTYGLGLINQLWAIELLAKMQLEDNQWIVRNAASEVLENKQKINKFIPKRLVAPSECPWLIAFAGKKGVGISPDSPATDLLLMALTEGTDAEQLASLDYLRAYSTSNVFAIFYKLMYGNNPMLREAIFRTIWEMGSRGVPIPDPLQFGVDY